MEEKRKKFLFDSNAIDLIFDESINLSMHKNSGFEFYKTFIQDEEVNAIPEGKADRKRKLINTLKLIPHVDHGPFLFDGGPENGFDSGLLIDNNLIQILNKIEQKTKSRTPFADAFVGITALLNEYCLVTNDKDFNKVAKEEGIEILNHKEFLELLNIE